MSTADLTNYDSIADRYLEQAEGKTSWNNLYERPYMLSIFDSFIDKNVLDIGGGTGFYTLHALKQNANVIAVDASREMLQHVESRAGSSRLKTVCADLSKGLPFIENESQDYIVCSLVLHYIENWNKIAAELARVLKIGGRIYISTHHPFSDYLYLKKENYFSTHLVTDTWGSSESPFEVHYFTRSLTDIIRPFLLPQLKFVNIEEPQPQPKCRELHEDIYQRLSTKPAFLFLTLEKQTPLSSSS